MEEVNEKNKNYIGWIIVAVVVIGLIAYMVSRAKDTEISASPSPSPESSNSVTLKSASNAPVSRVQQVQVISPNGGETWVRGKQYNIIWNTTGVSATEPVYLDLIKTSSVIRDPYAVAPGKVGGYELFHQSIFPKGLPKEGTISYEVLDTMTPGTYQLLIWAGIDCSVTKTDKKCAFDLSNGLITVK